jgi:hypothetical protein
MILVNHVYLIRYMIVYHVMITITFQAIVNKSKLLFYLFKFHRNLSTYFQSE